jgi:hypothetical protein
MATTLYLEITDQAKINSFQGIFQAGAIAQPTSSSPLDLRVDAVDPNVRGLR